MSTRSCVGRYTEGKNWEGVYVHWDGYPNHMGIQLQLIVARDGHGAGRQAWGAAPRNQPRACSTSRKPSRS